jgi:hypothetical protein
MFTLASPAVSLQIWNKGCARGTGLGAPNMPRAKSPARFGINSIPYKGINVIMLWSASVVNYELRAEYLPGQETIPLDYLMPPERVAGLTVRAPLASQ